VIEDGVEMECPAGHRVHRQTNNLYRFQFHWPRQLCNACPLKERCTQSVHGRLRIPLKKATCSENRKPLTHSPNRLQPTVSRWLF
jgi:hypothetical protein